jgi:hypothetical protein
LQKLKDTLLTIDGFGVKITLTHARHPPPPPQITRNLGASAKIREIHGNSRFLEHHPTLRVICGGGWGCLAWVRVIFTAKPSILNRVSFSFCRNFNSARYSRKNKNYLICKIDQKHHQKIGRPNRPPQPGTPVSGLKNGGCFSVFLASGGMGFSSVYYFGKFMMCSNYLWP